jgi:16S rRNA C1402 (ribose-2'-O) methylase RsmI
VKKKIFIFRVFCPLRKGKGENISKKMLGIEGIVVIYESPFRVKKLLNACFEILGDKRNILGGS